MCRELLGAATHRGPYAGSSEELTPVQADPVTAVPMIAAAVACLLHPPYREGQEDQLGALGLVVNAIVLWNTRYQNAALDQLRRDGHDAHDDDVRRLSPLGHDHINFLGRYQFSVTDLSDGQLRPLRDPAAAEV